MKIVDLSVPIVDQLPVDPGPQIAKIQYMKHYDPASLESILAMFPGATAQDLPDGAAWAVELLTLGTHTGTHMDAPWHYHPTMTHGEPSWTIDQVPLEWCISDGVMVDFTDKPDGYTCTSKDFKEYFEKVGYTLKPGDIVLVHTTAPEVWGTPAFLAKGCGVGREGTLWLAEQGVHIVGTDAWSWDPPLSYEAKEFRETGNREVIWEGHKAGKDCIYFQMEKLGHLDSLPPFGFKVIALPINIEKASAGWVRPVAIFEG